jgi:hypothetical protein
MTLEDLLISKLISKEMHDDYILFSVSETGSAWLKRRMHETFIEEPSPENCVGEAFAYCEGRRSLLRNILSLIERIETMLKETPNDD